MGKVSKTLFINFFVLTALTSFSLFGANQYPIVLVHGFIGWGPEEMGGYPYWGGNLDLTGYLESFGFEVFTVSVGPLSSNWERAVETFYQIKGGQVDYGKNHSDKWGIIQKPEGKYYSGLYPEWDRTHPVHFIGHSMGGQTIRMLAYQLTHSFQSDSIIDDDDNILMNIEHSGWIKSITAIATPHDGTTLSNLVSKTIPFLQNFIILGAVVGTKYYDFDLQHWGFNRRENESWINYYKRMRNHPSWNTKNICSWDLSIDGARELNTTLIAQPDIYYFSFTTSSTHKNNKSGKHLPDKNTSMLLRIRSRIIGSKTVHFSDGTATDSLWFENDGVVNTISQKGPTTGENGADPSTYYISSESVIPGQWYNMGKIKFDHWKIIGQGKMTIKEEEFLLSLYLDHCKRLWNLPN